MRQRVSPIILVSVAAGIILAGCGSAREAIYGVWQGAAPAGSQATLSDTITYEFQPDGVLRITYAIISLEFPYIFVDDDTIRFEGMDYDWQVADQTLTLVSSTETLSLQRFPDATPTP
jgi:hypothetical protein